MAKAIVDAYFLHWEVSIKSDVIGEVLLPHFSTIYEAHNSLCDVFDAHVDKPCNCSASEIGRLKAELHSAQEERDEMIPFYKAENDNLKDQLNKLRTENEALREVVKHVEKLRLAINPLLVEMPERSIVNGEDNFPFRLRILKLQVEAEQTLASLTVKGIVV